MWNRWTFNAAALVASAGPLAAQVAAPPEAPIVRYAWMAIEGGASSLHATIPVDAEWDACVLTAPIDPFDHSGVALLELVTGETLPGELVEYADDGVTWRTKRLGARTIPLLDVAAIRIDGAPLSERGATLRNGDLLPGDVAATSDGVEQNDLRVPWDRVSGVRLRATGDADPALRLWLRNGGVIHAREIEPRPGGLLVRTAHGAGLYQLGEVLALTRETLRVRELGEPDGSSRGVSPKPSGLSVAGPATASWELGSGVTAIVGVARTPEDSRKWGDALVTLWAGSEHVLSARTSPERPYAALAASADAAAGERLTLSVQPGAQGGANGVIEIALAVIERP